MTCRFYTDISEIGAGLWDTFAHPTGNPFLKYDFLHALEESGSVSAATGWQPYHMVLYEPDGTQPLALMPLYVKSHSYGEYVFDHSWAHAFERAGTAYYPKLQASIPFTPATGPRLLLTEETQRSALTPLVARALRTLSDRLGVSSLHITFLESAEAQDWQKAGFLMRRDQQFHWLNADYTSFQDFLDALSSRKRKQVRKERRSVAASGLKIRSFQGDEIRPEHWEAFFAFYLDTGARKWGRPYLNKEFFHLVGTRMPDDILLIMAQNEAGHYVAGALNFIGRDCLYGRYWGALTDTDFLHFEICYYRAIEFAITHGLKRVEAGAQGSHKLARGYLPKPTYSVHHITNPGFRDAVENFLKLERREIDHEINYITEHHTPFKKT